MDGPRDDHTKWSKLDWDSYQVIVRLYLESKIWHKWTYSQSRNVLADIENKHGYLRGMEVGEG